MSEMSDDDWADYQSGPFCGGGHWQDPSDCELVCKACGHQCHEHHQFDFPCETFVTKDEDQW